MQNPDLLLVYHAAASVAAALGAVYVMQVVGRRWTVSAGDATLQWLHRAGLGATAAALFATGVAPLDNQLSFVESACAPATGTTLVVSCLAFIFWATVLRGRYEH